MHNPDAEKRDFAWRLSLFYAAVFTVAGTQMPYLPVWLDWRGLSASEISMISAAPLFVRLAVTPTIAFAADRSGDHRRVLIALAWAGLATLALLALVGGFWPILALTLMFALFWTTIMPLTETVAMRGVRAAGIDYGRMRLWGSISFIAASFLGGLAVERWGGATGLWLVVTGAALTALGTHLLPSREVYAAGRGGQSRGGLSLAGAVALVRRPEFVLFMTAAGAVQAAHALLYTFGTIHWRSLGISATWCGLLWAVSVVAEVLLFAWSRPVLLRIGPVGLLLLGGGAAVIRWLAMAFDPALGWLLPLQVLHALTFGATHLGAVHFISAAVPEGQHGTAQALHASVTAGIAMGGATLAAGQLYAAWAGAAYLAMALIAAVGCLAGLALWRRWDGTALPG